MFGFNTILNWNDLSTGRVAAADRTSSGEAAGR
jgi:hypothetical protein